MQFVNAESFDDWRSAAQWLLAGSVSPADVQWIDGAAQPSLFGTGELPPPKSDASVATVPKEFQLSPRCNPLGSAL